MNALSTQLNAFHLSFNSMTDFDFRTFPTFSHVERNVHADKQGWDAYVYFNDGESVHVACKGYHVTLNGERFNSSNINEACVLSAGQPLRWSDLRNR
jgi:hypothetical protein